jgi:restriction system protein
MTRGVAASAELESMKEVGQMANITRRRTGELLRKVLEILLRHPDGLRAKEALTTLEGEIPPTEFEGSEYASGGRRFEKIVRFATVDAVKAGWLAKSKGIWSITEEGKRALDRFPDPEAFYREAIRLYGQWRQAHPPEPQDDTAESASREPSIDEEVEARSAEQTIEEAEEQAWSEVEEYLLKMNPYDFQELVAALLRGMGYHVSWIAPPGKDGGVDILASSDPLGTKAPRIKVQVKRYGSRVPADGLRSFMALLGQGDVGLFVSTGGFTKDAEEEARRQTDRRITLIDLERLFDLWVEHYDKLSDEARRRMPLKPIYFLAAEE